MRSSDVLLFEEENRPVRSYVVPAKDDDPDPNGCQYNTGIVPNSSAARSNSLMAQTVAASDVAQEAEEA